MVGCIPCTILCARPFLSGAYNAPYVLPTILTLVMARVSEPGIFWGILLSMGIGLPVFTWGKLSGNTSFKSPGK